METGRLAVRGEARVSNQSNDIPREVVFDVLSSTRRRHLLHSLLKDENGRATLRDMSRQIAAWENGISADQVSSKQRRRVYTALHQTHLPRMVRQGVVEYDQNSKVIELTASAGQLEVYLDIVPGNEIPWSEYYLGLGGLTSALAAALYLDVFPLALIPDLVWLMIVAVVFTASAATNVYYSRKLKLGQGDEPPI